MVAVMMTCSIAAVDSFLLPGPQKLVSKPCLQSPSSLSVSVSSSPSPSPSPNKNAKLSKTTDPDSYRYIQWNHQKDLWKMQTAVTTFRRPGDQKVVELCAQQHFGDANYFRYWNSDERFNDRHDAVLFELLVDQELLEYDHRNGDWRVTQSIMASANDQNFAQNLGLRCQASIIDYTKSDKWIHADLSRQEFQKLAAETNKRGSNSNNNSNDNTPLWKLASPDSSSTAAEAVAALMVGPPTLEFASTNNPRKRRLFTNLFLPGGQLASGIRALLWMTVPAPELSIILLDWSSLLQGGSNVSALSQVALPILTSLVKFDIGQMRRFLFGQQVLMSSKTNGMDTKSKSSSSSDSSWSLLVLDRNDHALNVLKRKLEEPSVKSVAVLYGSSHCPDLHNKLVAMGFRATEKKWRTAWSVQESTTSASSSSSTIEGFASDGQQLQGQALPVLGAFVVFYLIIGALDWVGIVGDTSSSLIDSNYLDATLGVGLYLLRHVLLYLGLSKFLIDWTNNTDR